jgi:predicted RNase H-like HicB family nuclease
MYIEVYKSNDDMYVAACPDLELFSKGRTRKEAIEKLENDINCYLESAEKVEKDLKETARYYGLNFPQKH